MKTFESAAQLLGYESKFAVFSEITDELRDRYDAAVDSPKLEIKKVLPAEESV